jgi:ATP-independent RNA helicase DbpA
MGFYDEIAGILSACPKRRQTLLFSATYPDDIRAATEAFLADPVEVIIEARHDNSKIEQRFYEVGNDNRDQAVGRLLKHFNPASAIAFCNTKAHCRELADALRADGFTALALYGELEQRERDEILVLFANRSATVLVATDVAARGLDISNLEAVINADVSKDTEVHIHRIGRTGRGDEQGLALTLCGPTEKKWVKLIEEYQGAPVEWHSLPADEDSAADPAPMMTLCILAGKKDKLRPGDVLGALTGDGGLAKEQVGKINVFEFNTYVALDRRVAWDAFGRLTRGSREGGDFGSFKGRNFKMRFVEV